MHRFPDQLFPNLSQTYCVSVSPQVHHVPRSKNRSNEFVFRSKEAEDTPTFEDYLFGNGSHDKVENKHKALKWGSYVEGMKRVYSVFPK